MHKFPSIPFNTHCAQWAEDAGSWLTTRKELPPSSFLELRFDDLRSCPATLIQQLEDFLHIPGSHAFNGELPWIEAGAPYNGSTFWSRTRYEIFNTICFDVMSEYGFKFENQFVDAKDTIYLRPPFVTGEHTQITRSSEEFVFCEPSVEGVWVMIHPNESARPPTQLTYRNVCLYSHNKFSAKVKLDGTESKPVRFRLRLLKSKDRSVVCDSTIDVHHGEEKEWIVSFSEAYDVFEVEISTMMTSPTDTNNCSWAKILRPRLISEGL
jgi:hypothetical protein